MCTLFPLRRRSVRRDRGSFLLVETLAIHLTASNLARASQQANHPVGGGIGTTRVREELLEFVDEIRGALEECGHLVKYLGYHLKVSAASTTEW